MVQGSTSSSRVVKEAIEPSWAQSFDFFDVSVDKVVVYEVGGVGGGELGRGIIGGRLAI